MEITTENYNYEAGDLVRGVLNVPNSANFKPTKVEICLIGMAEVKWMEMSPFTFEWQKASKCLELVNFVSEQDLDNLNKETDIEQIHFEFELPDKDIPSSFQSSEASIQYNIMANIKGETGQTLTLTREIKVRAPFRVKGDLSIGNSAEKDFGLLSLATGRIIVNAWLDRKGYVAGETIDVKCNVYNQSSVEATPRVTLIQTRIVKCGQRHKASQTALREPVVGNRVESQSNSEQTLSIDLPEEVSLSIKTELIAVKYFIHVTLDIPHAFDIHVNLPFVVTTQSAIET